MRKATVAAPFVFAAALAAVAFAPSAAANPQIAKKAGCTACHDVDIQLVGPAYKDVAKKYKGDAGAAEKLAAKVRKGGKGVWGDVPMTPNEPAKISDADLKTVIAWILKL